MALKKLAMFALMPKEMSTLCSQIQYLWCPKGFSTFSPMRLDPGTVCTIVLGAFGCSFSSVLQLIPLVYLSIRIES